MIRVGSGTSGLSPFTMLRNLYTWNVRPSSPTRSCRNSTGPRDVNATTSPISSPTGTSTGEHAISTTQSSARCSR